MTTFAHTAPSDVDAADPLVSGGTYAAAEQFAIRIPATGTFLDLNARALANGALVNMAYPAGGTGPVDAANATPAEVALMEYVGLPDASVQSFADADTPYVWSIPNASSVEAVSFVLGDRRSNQDRKSSLLSFTPSQLKETAAPWTHTVEGDQDVLRAIDVPEFYNWTIKSRVLSGDVLELTFNSVHRDNGDLAVPDLGVDTFGGLFSRFVRYASAPTLNSVTTARYQPDHDYIAGDPILEPNPADNFAPYTWTADADFTSGPDPDFDGTGFTVQEKATVAIGLETDILNSTSQPKTFSGRSIAKATDITLDQSQVVRLFRPALATQLYGHGNDQMLHALDPANGKVYSVRDGQTVTKADNPSENGQEWTLQASGVVPVIALADLLQIPFPSLVNLSGLTYWSIDTTGPEMVFEKVTWEVRATPANVNGRKAYVANQTAPPVENTAGRWVVTSPGPEANGVRVVPSVVFDSDIAHQIDLGASGDVVIIANLLQTAISGTATITLSLTNFTWDDDAPCKFIDYYVNVGSSTNDRVNIVLDPDSFIGTPNFTVSNRTSDRVAHFRVLCFRGLKGQFVERPVRGTIYSKVQDQLIPDGAVHTYATDLPDLVVGDRVTVVASRGTELFDLTSRYLFPGQTYDFVFVAGESEWVVEVVGSQLRVTASGDGGQAIKAIFVER